jgi:hypothetical protein
MMIRPRHLLALLLTLALCGLSAHAQQTEGLQQRMSQAEFEAAGLNRLSPQELQNLDNWLHAHGKIATRMVDSSGAPVFYADKAKRSRIDAHIKGHFSGWNGANEYTLDNGQAWQQVHSDSDIVSCMTADNPSAKVKPAAIGTWLMYVSGCNGTVHVKRVR